MRERVIFNNMTRMMGELATDAETEVTSRFHQEIPAIRLDGHLTYCFYITIQNFIHLNVIHILLYHAVFWLNPAKSHTQLIRNIENTEYEQTLFVSMLNNRDEIIRTPINLYLINKYIYITLIGVSSIELIAALIWTLQKKLFFLINKNPKCRNLLGLLLLGMIINLYLGFIAWIFFHTFITHYLTVTTFLVVVIHFIVLTLLDKPNLFRSSSTDLSKESFPSSNITRKQHRHSSSSSSSMTLNLVNRLSYRLSTPMQSRKVNVSLSSLIFSSRWLSITEDKLDIHKCSILYEQIREEADDLWLMVVRRMILSLYRTFASFILFDLVPIKMMGKTNICSVQFFLRIYLTIVIKRNDKNYESLRNKSTLSVLHCISI